MCKRYEVTYQRTGGNYHRTKHDILCLRLQDENYQCKEIDEHKGIVYLTDTYLIIIAGADEVYHSCDGEYHNECQHSIMSKRYIAVVCRECKAP